MQYKKFIENLSIEAGSIIKNNFQSEIEDLKKDDRSHLTQADLEINKLVIDRIKTSYPEHSVLGEEESNILENSEYVWVCDPIDGTLPFIAGIPVSVFSLALTHKGESIAAGVYDPFQERFYYAEKNLGAYVNDIKLNVSEDSSLDGMTIGVAFRKGFTYNILEGLENLYNEHVTLLNVYSIIYMGMLVASGHIAAVVFPKNTAHDAASVKLIVEEAGGRVTDLFGEDQDYDKETKGFVASNGVLHEKILESLGNIKHN